MLLGRLHEVAQHGLRSEVQAEIYRTAIFVEQCALQGGTTYKMAWLLTGLEEPPWDRLSSRKPLPLDDPQNTYVYSRLADPRLVASCLGHMQDLEKLATSTTKLHRPTRPPRKRGKGKGKEPDVPE